MTASDDKKKSNRENGIKKSSRISQIFKYLFRVNFSLGVIFLILGVVIPLVTGDSTKASESATFACLDLGKFSLAFDLGMVAGKTV